MPVPTELQQSPHSLQLGIVLQRRHALGMDWADIISGVGTPSLRMDMVDADAHASVRKHNRPCRKHCIAMWRTYAPVWHSQGSVSTACARPICDRPCGELF
eukprot:363801-Chlamydomonas_euryale.AAC.8